MFVFPLAKHVLKANPLKPQDGWKCGWYQPLNAPLMLSRFPDY